MIGGDNDCILNNCFIDTTWYLPGQKFPRTIISTDRNSAEYFKTFNKTTNKSRFQKIGISNYNLKDKTVVDIVKYIQNVSQTYDMKFTFSICVNLLDMINLMML